MRPDSGFSGADCGDGGEFTVCDIPPVIGMAELQPVTYRKGPPLRFVNFSRNVVSVVPFNRAGLHPSPVFGSKDEGCGGPIHPFDDHIAVLADALALLDACASAMDDVSFLIASGIG